MELVIIPNFITLRELCSRWNCLPDLIFPYTENKLNHRGFHDLPPDLQPYRIKDVRECGKGQVKGCTAEKIPALNEHCFRKDKWARSNQEILSIGDVVFHLEQVQQLEKANPALLCSPVKWTEERPKDDFCELLLIEEKIFTVPELIARWCGIPEEEIPVFVDWECQPATQNSTGAYYLHSNTNECFNVKMDYFVKAIRDNRIIICDESGTERECIAGHRTRISGKRAREFFEREQVTTGFSVPDFLIPAFEKQSGGTSVSLKGRVDELTAENSRTKGQLAEFEKQAESASPGVEELLSKLEQYESKNTTINASQWKIGITAALNLYAEIFSANESGIIEADFQRRLHEKTGKDYLTTVDSIAWKNLPEKFKQGRGRPKSE